jgi:putative transcriptional regulator
MVTFKLKELLIKNNMSRYKLRQYTGLTYERVNQFYFGTAKALKIEEIEILCKTLNCNITDIIEYKK